MSAFVCAFLCSVCVCVCDVPLRMPVFAFDYMRSPPQMCVHVCVFLPLGGTLSPAERCASQSAERQHDLKQVPP